MFLGQLIINSIDSIVNFLKTKDWKVPHHYETISEEQFLAVKAESDLVRDNDDYEFPGILSFFRWTIDPEDLHEIEVLEPLEGNYHEVFKVSSFQKLLKEDLKSMCKSLRLRVGGNKPDLIERLVEYSKKERIRRGLGGIGSIKFMKVYAVAYVCSCVVAKCSHVGKIGYFPVPE